MKICVFDTETTGLLKPAPARLEAQPYIIELYACIIDEEFNMLDEFDSMFKVDFPLPEIINKITGITDKMLEDKPKFSSKVPELAKFITGCDIIVAHNYKFDEGMLANELLRCDKLIKFPWPRHQICTVQNSMAVRGHRLKLGQLHQEMTGKPFSDGAHRARNDVHALVRSFHGLVEKGLVKLEDYQ